MFQYIFHPGIGNKKIVQLTKIIFVLVPLITLAVVINDNYLFTPTLSYLYRPGHRLTVVAPLSPTLLLRTADPTMPWVISADSFPFGVTLPRLIESVIVQIKLDPGSTQYLTLNAKTRNGGEYSTVIASTFLDSLDWKHVTDGATTLWMRDKHIGTQKIVDGTGKNAKIKNVTTEVPVRQYTSLAEFRQQPPDLSTIGAVGFDHLALATVPNYQSSQTPITINHTLRSSHRLYVYAANEDIHLTFDKIDLNKQKGPDMLTIRVARADQIRNDNQTWLKTIIIPDDGNTSALGPRGDAQRVDITVPDVKPGSYLVDILGSEDILLSHLTSNQQHLVFNGRVWLADGPAYGETNFTPTHFLTNGTTVSAAEVHEQGKQDIIINGHKLSLKEIKINQPVSGLTNVTQFDVAKGDVTVSGDGLLTIAPAELIPDGLRALDLSTTPDVSAYDYILAEYLPRSTTSINIRQKYMVDDLALKVKQLNFSIESPGRQSTGATLGLENIRATLIRGPFPWHQLGEKIFGLKKTL